MDDQDRLALYPFVILKGGLRGLPAQGRLSPPAPRREIRPGNSLRDLLDRFSYDCLWRAEARDKHGVSSCGIYLPHLDHPRPPARAAVEAQGDTSGEQVHDRRPGRATT